MSVGKFWKKLFSGKYDFFANGNQYAEESFEVVQHTQNKTLIYKSYLFTRSTTGELLKVFTDYELGENYQIKLVKIQKNAGKWTTTEYYLFEPKDNTLHFKIETPEGEHQEQKAIHKKFCIQTPSALCSSIFAINKKIDSQARNPVTLIKSPNLLTYEKPLEETTVFATYEIKEGQTFNINQNHFPYLRCEIYATDVGELENEFPIVIQISKKFGLPFLIQFNREHQARLVQLDTAADIDATSL